MEWIKIVCIHNYNDIPFEFYLEIDENRFNIRKVEYFKNKKIGYAFEEIEVNGTGLAEKAFPSVDEYNDLNNFDDGTGEEIHAFIISKEEFELKWNEAIRGSVSEKLF